MGGGRGPGSFLLSVAAWEMVWSLGPFAEPATAGGPSSVVGPPAEEALV